MGNDWIKVFCEGIVLFLLFEALWYYFGVFFFSKYETIKIKYHSPSGYLKEIKQGTWQDVQAVENVSMKFGELKYISLGFSIQLPEGYEAHLSPRSSTYKTWGVIQGNGVGVIDETYCGDDDVWKFPAVALRDTEIKIGDRIAQFRIVRKTAQIVFQSG